MLKFGTKAETLSMLEGCLRQGRVLPQICFTVGEWHSAGRTLDVLRQNHDWLKSIIVRSSALSEDTSSSSMAGCYKSVSNVKGPKQRREAIEVVISSMDKAQLGNQVFLQPMLEKVEVSGVAFSRDPNNGGHYYVINYDEVSGVTSAVQSGLSNDLAVRYHAKKSSVKLKGWQHDLLLLLQELEELFDNDALDVEFAVDNNGLILLQVRPLILKTIASLAEDEHDAELNEIENKICSLTKPHPYLLGGRSVFGIMPDWNPAEMIGVRPRPLALSLYMELITDNIWAYQRNNYGYRNLRSFPLLISFAGLPYIDVRVSFNSFIPKNLDEKLAYRLVDFYIDRLCNNPNLHDKVEFDIVYSCYTLDLPERLSQLPESNFSSADKKQLLLSLRNLTNNIIHDKQGLWKKDLAKLDELKFRQMTIATSNLSKIERIFWLLEDCKRYGTLPFAGLARAGFIAVQMLKSLVRCSLLSDREYECFMSTIETISSCLSRDFIKLSKKRFLEKYGHLRPGAYDILSPRYDEDPERYFDWKQKNYALLASSCSEFALNISALNRIDKFLNKHEITHDVVSLFNFIKGAIEGREYAKFIFTKSLSEILRILRMLGEEHGYSAEDISFIEINNIKQLYASSGNFVNMMQENIDTGRQNYAKTRSLSLPSLITSPDDIWSFNLLRNEPNFISMQAVSGSVVTIESELMELNGNILMIPSADPGYDWIFSHGIGGFITKYGGVNSHMAIRAGELGIPAIIGAGEILYSKWSAAHNLEIDCANRRVRVLM